MTEITEKEKELLRSKLQEIISLESKDNILKETRKELESSLEIYKPELDTTLQAVNTNRVKYNKVLVSRIRKCQHRKPSLTITYQAVNNILGKEAEKTIKENIAAKRKREKQKILTENGKETLKILPTKELRKVRKDKGTRNGRKSETKPKKLKYMKREA